MIRACLLDIRLGAWWRVAKFQRVANASSLKLQGLSAKATAPVKRGMCVTPISSCAKNKNYFQACAFVSPRENCSLRGVLKQFNTITIQSLLPSRATQAVLWVRRNVTVITGWQGRYPNIFKVPDSFDLTTPSPNLRCFGPPCVQSILYALCHKCTQ
jgi:hypothetical protein